MVEQQLLFLLWQLVLRGRDIVSAGDDICRRDRASDLTATEEDKRDQRCTKR
jgi:hypothetical protein